jgi:hypothetical protein
MPHSRDDMPAAIDRLREYHRVGTEILTEFGPGRDPGMDKISKRYGLGVHVVRVLRKFADEDHGYTEAELNELCAQSEKHGYTVGVTQLRHLVTIGDKKERARFQRQMIRGKWSNSETVAELVRRFGRRRKGGRKPHVAADVPGVLLQLEGFAVAWRRWSERLADEDDDQVKVRTSDLAKEVQAAVAKVTEAFAALNTVVSRPQGVIDVEDRAADRRRRPKDKTHGKRK